MVTALSIATIGILGAFAGTLLGQSSGDPTSVAPWISGGSSVAAVAALAYIARKLASGDLVARNTAETEQKLVKLIETSQRQQEEGSERERSYHRLLLEHLGRGGNQ